MARKCKCQICGRQLTTDIAFKVAKGNRNLYYCDSIEYDIYMDKKEKQKRERDNIHEYVDKILGYKCINNQVNKEISEINKLYKLEDVSELLKDKIESISELILFKNIDKEYNKIRYIFGALNRDIHDFAEDRINQKKKTNIQETKIEEIENQFSSGDHKFKAKETTNFTNFI